MNSAISSVDADDLMNEAYLLASQGLEAIFVEGGFDQKLIMKAANLEPDRFIICNGKKLQDKVYDIFVNQKDIVAKFVRDRDYDVFICKGTSTNRVITRYRDIEGDLIAGKTLRSIIISCLAAAKYKEFSPEILLDASSAIGNVRRYSFEQRLNISFNDIKYEKFFDGDEFSAEDFCQYLCAKNARHDLYEACLSSCVPSEGEMRRYDICGEDFFKLLQISLHKLNSGNRKSPGDEFIKRQLIANADREDINYICNFIK